MDTPRRQVAATHTARAPKAGTGHRGGRGDKGVWRGGHTGMAVRMRLCIPQPPKRTSACLGAFVF